jgi:hypothetical protein
VDTGNMNMAQDRLRRRELQIGYEEHEGRFELQIGYEE